jgi:hypothetical protein
LYFVTLKVFKHLASVYFIDRAIGKHIEFVNPVQVVYMRVFHQVNVDISGQISLAASKV